MCTTKRLLFRFAITVLWCNPTTVLAQQYGWKVIAKPTNRDLNAIEFVDPLHGWCAGNDGNIFFTKNGGLTWGGSVRPSDPIITDLSFSDSLNGWAVGNYGGSAGLIWRTDNGGVYWTQQVAPDTRFVLRHWSTSAQNVTNNTTVGTRFALADTGILRMTTDGGISWKRRTLADSIVGFGKVVFVDPLHGWITAGLRSGTSALLRTQDGGKGWQIIHLKQGLPVITFLDTLRGWGVYRGDIHHSSDGGNTWKFQFSISGADDDLTANAISFADSLNGWVFGIIFYQGDLAGAIYRTTDGGRSWYREHVGKTRKIWDGLMLDKYHGWAVGEGGVVLAYGLVTGVFQQPSNLPKKFSLKQNYPNPFNPTTEIEYEIAYRSMVTMKVYDIYGREVELLVNEEKLPGVYRIRFDGSGLANGVYYYTMKTDSFTETKQMILSK